MVYIATHRAAAAAAAHCVRIIHTYIHIRIYGAEITILVAHCYRYYLCWYVTNSNKKIGYKKEGRRTTYSTYILGSETP